MPPLKNYFLRNVALPAAWIGLTLLSLPQAGFAAEQPMSIPGHICEPLPVGELTDEQLKELVPDGSPGKVRVRWATESQDNVYGFNVMRADSDGGPFRKINRSVIPGEGTTNLPKSYCYLDNTAERGKTYWYYIEEVTLDGQRKAIEETKGKDGKGTRVTVRQVEAERQWLRERARQAANPTPAPIKSSNATSPTAVKITLNQPTTETTVTAAKVNPLE